MPNRILYYSNIVKAEWNAKSLLDLHSRTASYIIQIYRKVRAEQSSLLEIVMPNRILYYSNIVKAEWNAKSLLDLHYLSIRQAAPRQRKNE